MNVQIGKSYELKNNIIVDVKEDLNSVTIGFNDYKFYMSDNYSIDKSVYDYYYFYNDTYWKAVCYQKFKRDDESNTFLSTETVYESNKFSIISNYNFKSDMNFLLIIKNEKGEIENIYEEKQNSIPQTLNNINVFNSHLNEIDRNSGEYYILVESGNKI